MKNNSYKIYYNSRKKTFSIKHNNRVICHTNNIWINNPVFSVSLKGRERVLKEKKKNVHAYIIGDVIGHGKQGTKQVIYNPYRFSTFVLKRTLKPVYQAKLAHIFMKDQRPYIYI